MSAFDDRPRPGDTGRKATPQTPDLTRQIMGRLGYMPAQSHVVRRRRLRRYVSRSTMLGASIAVVIAGTVVYHAGPHARRPIDQTIPAVLGNEVREHQQQWGRTFRTIRDLAPAPAAPPTVEYDEGAELIAVGPVRWL